LAECVRSVSDAEEREVNAAIIRKLELEGRLFEECWS
jgi:hypothetical protein